jgi:nucleotide-binding universal stress UspA family protein
MRILATFDESPFSEATVPVLAKLAALPNVEIYLRSVAVITAAVDASAIGRRKEALDAYLRGIESRLPTGPTYRISVDVAMYPMDAAAVLVERAQSERPDVIVMATHGRSGVARMLMGSVADKVVRSGIAPVLLVHPRPER